MCYICDILCSMLALQKMYNYPYQTQNGISEDTVTELTIDTFERLPSEFTKPSYDFFQSESTIVSN